MRLTCMVCRELLVPSDDVNVAPCGHYLHYTCWVEWLERAKNCPQCRAKTTVKQLVKLFFNTADTEEGEPDAATLTNKIDSLTFEIRMKNKDIDNLKELVQTTKTQNTGLREEIKKYRDDADEAKSTCGTLQEKIRYLQRQNKEAQDAKRECEKLRAQNERLKNLETVVRGSSTEVKSLVERTPCTPEALRNLALFCASLKSVLEESKNKRNQLRDLYDSEKSECKKLREENRLLKGDLETASTSNKRLTDDVNHLEEEKKSLTKKISELQAAILSPTASSAANKALKRLIAESPAPAIKRTLDSLDDSVFDADDDISTTPVLEVGNRNAAVSCGLRNLNFPGHLDHPTGPGRAWSSSQASTSQARDSDASPLFGLKPKVVKDNALKRPLSNSNISIFGNRLLKPPPVKSTSAHSEGYDGMGGHSRVDEFPEPRGPIKKLKPSPSKSIKKKLSAPVGVPKLTAFDGFLDLS